MIVYHGSDTPVETPIMMKSARMLDFGEGFYTTFNREQAIRWAERVAAKRESETRFITEFELDLQKAIQALRMIRFEKADEQWLDFVCQNRMGTVPAESYDMVIGPVADDAVYTTIILYEQRVLDKDETIRRLKIQEPFNQVLFHTEKSLMFCQYLRHYEIG